MINKDAFTWHTTLASKRDYLKLLKPDLVQNVRVDWQDNMEVSATIMIGKGDGLEYTYNGKFRFCQELGIITVEQLPLGKREFRDLANCYFLLGTAVAYGEYILQTDPRIAYEYQIEECKQNMPFNPEQIYKIRISNKIIRMKRSWCDGYWIFEPVNYEILKKFDNQERKVILLGCLACWSDHLIDN